MSDRRMRAEKVAKTDVSILELLKNRWSPRAFADRPVEVEKLRQVLEAARWAPSSYNEQPWRYILAQKEDEEQFDRVLNCLNNWNQRWAKHAPVLMISVAKKELSRNGKPNRSAFHDVGQATAHLTVQAASLDLYVHQMGGILPDRIRKTFKVPERFEPVAGLALGYLGDSERLPEDLRESERAERKRKPLKNLVFDGEWGTASSAVEKK